jgi:hypothetical protein
MGVGEIHDSVIAGGMEIPDSKFQVPNKFQTRNYQTSQTADPPHTRFELEA